MNAPELREIADRAQRGDSRAQAELAILLAQAGEQEQARVWLDRAVSGGFACEATRLGLWEIAGYGGARALERGLRRISDCAATGDAKAMQQMAMLLAGGVGVATDVERGLHWLCAAARAGESRAITQLGVLQGVRNQQAAGGLSEGLDPRRLAAGISLDWALSDPLPVVECESPRMVRYPRFLPSAICDYVIAMAAPLLRPGLVVDRSGGESRSEERSNSVMNFGIGESDFILELVNQRCARAAGMPVQNAEGLGVLNYRPGEQYRAHVDYIAETPANAAHIAARGQRSRTLLVYLNDEYDGGATSFPRLGTAFKPEAGTALLFHSIDASGRVDPRTLHAGTPTSRGEKWVISKWFRTRSLRPAPGELHTGVDP